MLARGRGREDSRDMAEEMTRWNRNQELESTKHERKLEVENNRMGDCDMRNRRSGRQILCHFRYLTQLRR